MSRRRRSSLPTSAWSALCAFVLALVLLANRAPAPMVITGAIIVGILTEFVALYIGHRRPPPPVPEVRIRIGNQVVVQAPVDMIYLAGRYGGSLGPDGWVDLTYGLNLDKVTCNGFALQHERIAFELKVPR